MKRLYLISLLLAFAVISKAQKKHCLTIKGDARNGKFQHANLSTSIPDLADMTQREIVASAWTCVAQNQDRCNFMALLRFDVSAIPANTVITGAGCIYTPKTAASMATGATRHTDRITKPFFKRLLPAGGRAR